MDLTAIAEDMPPLTNDLYDIEVRLLHDPARGTLYIPRAVDLRRDYESYIEDAKQLLKDSKELAETVKQIEERRDQEIALYARVENERAADIRSYSFRFRPASVEDVEEAERLSLAPAAAPTSPGAPAGRTRNELTYRRVLAARTFKLSNIVPECKKIETLRSDIGLHLLAEVATRVNFKQNVLDFLS